jgi:hypothetical protein
MTQYLGRYTYTDIKITFTVISQRTKAKNTNSAQEIEQKLKI